MPPENHALLGASSAHRWLNCPGSVLLTKDIPDVTSPYAEAGRLAHEIAELKARQYFVETLPKRSFNAKLKKLQSDLYYDKAMDDATDEYLDHLKARAMTYSSAPSVALEIQVDFSDIVPGGFGTADCVMIGGGCLDIVDYKNGSGVPVEAENNPQMMLYAYGALQYFRPIYGDSITRVHLSIVQPHAGGVKEWEVGAANIRNWGKERVSPTAAKAVEADAPLKAGDWCRFCKAKATCMERAKVMFEIEPLTGSIPAVIGDKIDNSGEGNLLSDSDIGGILTRGRAVATWLKDLENYALKATLEGRLIPGWKTVEGRGSREWNGGSDTAFDHLLERGVPRAILYEERPVSVAGLEKALGKKAFAEAAEGLWRKTPGKPTLVPESDNRPPYNAAAAAFDAATPNE